MTQLYLQTPSAIDGFAWFLNQQHEKTHSVARVGCSFFILDWLSQRED